jgi:transcriptional regulator with XRE-family HTH domain
MDDIKAVIRDNVRRLLGLDASDKGIAQLMRKTGFKNGTAQRVLQAETSIGVDLLTELARGLGVEPWQLLVRDLDPDNLPTLHPPSTRWPFRQVDQEAVASLSGSQAQAVEAGLLVALASAGAPSRKPRALAA